MNKLNRDKFFFGYQGPLGMLSPNAKEGLEYLLTCLENDPHIIDLRHAAYMLATTLHETAGTFRPIHESGARAYFIKRYGSQTKVGKELGNDTPEEGADYAGRGFPQVTGESNYEMIEKALRKEYPAVVARFEARTGRTFDLTVGDQPNDSSDPDNLMDPELAYCAMSYGMRKGAFTGAALKRYIHDGVCDYVNARRIINGTDCAAKIAGYAGTLEVALREATTI